MVVSQVLKAEGNAESAKARPAPRLEGSDGDELVYSHDDAACCRQELSIHELSPMAPGRRGIGGFRHVRAVGALRVPSPVLRQATKAQAALPHLRKPESMSTGISSPGTTKSASEGTGVTSRRASWQLWRPSDSSLAEMVIVAAISRACVTCRPARIKERRLRHIRAHADEWNSSGRGRAPRTKVWRQGKLTE